MAEAKAYKLIPHLTKDTITYEMYELVRCKDCKHHGSDTCSAGAGMAYPPPEDWFCADGERK